MRKNPISFQARTYFLTSSQLTRRRSRKVAECSAIFVVSKISPLHDMRTKFSSRQSIILAAGLSTSAEPGNWRTRTDPFSKTGRCSCAGRQARLLTWESSHATAGGTYSRCDWVWCRLGKQNFAKSGSDVFIEHHESSCCVSIPAVLTPSKSGSTFRVWHGFIKKAMCSTGFQATVLISVRYEQPRDGTFRGTCAKCHPASSRKQGLHRRSQWAEQSPLSFSPVEQEYCCSTEDSDQPYQ